MSAKPAPPSAIWGSSPSANVVEPGTTKRGLGWVNAERPYEGHLNQVLRDHDLVAQYLLDGDLAGAHSIAGSLSVTGSISAGDLKHGDRSVAIAAPGFMITSNVLGVPALTTDWSGFGSPPNDTVRAAVQLDAGSRVKSVAWHISKGGSSALMICTLRTRNGTTNTDVDVLSDSTSGASYVSVLRTLGTPYIVAAGDAITLVVQGTNSAHRLSHAVVVYDRP